jgi:hypothetical protein
MAAVRPPYDFARAPEIAEVVMPAARFAVVTFAIALCCASPFAAQTANAARPIILSSSTTPTLLTINGSHLAPGTASVLLGSFGPLAVVSQSATELVVALPSGLAPGDYVLSVHIAKGKGNADDDGNSDESVVTIGAVGPAGPPGPQGPQGVPGPSGSSDVFSVTLPSVELRILPRVVATLNVPAGQYWIVFTSTVTNNTTDILNPDDTIACAIDGVSSPNSVRLGPDVNQGVMTLQGVASFAAPSTISVHCSGFTLFFFGRSDNNTLTALKVGAIH